MSFSQLNPTQHVARVREILMGRYHFLVAVPKGRSSTLVCNDFDHTLEQVEQRFEKRLRKESDPFIPLLQPFLEG